jgi:radical SAM superfamily enzyme YgiQ (UPF0313 family)
LGGKQKAREFPLEPFLADMEKLIERSVRTRSAADGQKPPTFKFLDRTFNLNAERAKKIIDFFLAKIEKGLSLCVHFEMAPSLFPADLAELLRRFPTGALRLEIGIQTLNPKVSALIGRPMVSGGQFSRELETLAFLRRETNAILHVDLIAGLPVEDLASFGAGFDKLWQVLCIPAGRAPFEIQLGILKCLPGTAIARHNENHMMRYSTEPPYEVIETGSLPAAELERIKNFARFWELIVNRNPFPDLILKLFPPGKPVFNQFMELSEKLLEHFGRNWGIEQKEIRSCLASMLEI